VSASADFLVVGGGIAGASVAWQLSRTHSVALLEAESQPGMHATGRSAAFFSEIYGNDTIRAITAASRAFFESPPAGFSDLPLLEPCGCLIYGTPAQQDGLHAHYEELRARSPGVSLESARFACERVPVLNASLVSACIWEPGAQRIDVNALLQGFLRGARAQGTRIMTDAEVQAIDRGNGGWRVATPSGEFRGRVLVNAAGAWADRVATLAGVPAAGLLPMRRTACIVECDPEPDCRDWPGVTDADENYYFMPDAGRLLVSPADETPAEPGDAYPDDLDVAQAVDRLEQATSLSVRRVVQQWAGLRTFTRDRTPVVGFDPTNRDFFWLAGQGGYGIQTAPALSGLAASLLRRDARPAPLANMEAALAPGRA
jgi:D-arginine dehydrogenase